MFFPEPVLHRKEVKDVPFLVLLLLLAGAIILQTTVLDYVDVLGIKPDLIMLIVVLNGFLLGTREGAFWVMPPASWKTFLPAASSD